MTERRVGEDPIEPTLTTLDTTMIVVSLVIGIGIFRTPAVVAAAAGGPGLFLTAWVVGGVVSGLGALGFAEIGSRFPRPGAYYGVVADCYHPGLAFALNWAGQLMQGAGAAGVAFVGAEHLVPLLAPLRPAGPGEQGAVHVVAIALMAALLGINYLGVKPGSRALNVLTVLKVLMIAVLGFAAFLAPRQTAAGPIPAAPAGVAGGLASALVAVFYTFGGYQNTINLGGDVRNARRRLPGAVLFGMAIIVTVYLGINAAYLHCLGFERMVRARLVAAEVARVCFGAAGQAVVSAAIFLSAAGFVNATILQVPRAYYAMAEGGGLPAFFLRVNPRTQVQEAGLIFFGATMLLPALFLGSFEKLLSYVMFTDSLSLAVVASTIFVLRARARSEPGARPDAVSQPRMGIAGNQRSESHPGADLFSAPGYPILPALFVFFLLGVSAHVLITETRLAVVGTGVMLAGYVIFLLMTARGRHRT